MTGRTISICLAAVLYAASAAEPYYFGPPKARQAVTNRQFTGIPALGACCMRALVPELSGCGFPVFPIGMYMRDTYLDKPV